MIDNVVNRIIKTEKYCNDSPTKTRKHAIIETAKPKAATLLNHCCIPEKQKQKTIRRANIEIYLVC